MVHALEHRAVNFRLRILLAIDWLSVSRLGPLLKKLSRVLYGTARCTDDAWSMTVGSPCEVLQFVQQAAYSGHLKAENALPLECRF